MNLPRPALTLMLVCKAKKELNPHKTRTAPKQIKAKFLFICLLSFWYNLLSSKQRSPLLFSTSILVFCFNLRLKLWTCFSFFKGLLLRAPFQRFLQPTIKQTVKPLAQIVSSLRLLLQNLVFITYICCALSRLCSSSFAIKFFFHELVIGATWFLWLTREYLI